MTLNFESISRRRQLVAGMTLAEVLVCIVIVVLVSEGVINGYIQSAKRAEWSGYSLAAQALALEQLEQIRATTWDSLSDPPTDQTTDLNLINWKNKSGTWTGYAVNQLDLPVSGTNTVLATNYVTVTTVVNSVNSLATYKMIRVDTVWPFSMTGQYFTNTIVTYRAPDQ